MKRAKKRVQARLWAVVLVCTAAAAWCSPARGQATRPAVDARGRQTVRLYVGQSKIIDAPWPVKRVSVGRPETADVQMITPERVQVLGKTSGATELTMWNAGEQTVEVAVDVTADLRGLEIQLGRLFPRAKLQLEQLDETVIVRGEMAKVEEGAQLRQLLQSRKLTFVDMTRIAGVQQVQLQVRVAEVSRRALQALGINGFMGGSSAFGGLTIGSSTGPLVPVNIGAPKGASATGNVPFNFLSDASVPSAVTMFGGFPGSDLAVFIQALEEDQFLQLLAEPKLVALSGEEATFLAGGEFPIPIVQGTGGASSSITIEYKPYGVKLSFRPTVLGDGKIRLMVAPEVSELSEVGAVQIQGFQVPSLVMRRVQTTIELNSGQTFGLAGLISRSTNARNSKVPGLGDLPVLGALFRSVRYQRNETELVVLVTASLVEPLSVESMPAVPGEGHVAPDAWELYAMGRIEGKTPARLHSSNSEHLKELGLDQLKGPGAWASYPRQPPAAR